MERDMIIPPESVIDEVARFGGDVVFGDRSRCIRDLESRGRIFAGQNVSFSGSLRAEGEIWLDAGCDVAGDVISSQSIHLLERVRVRGAVKSGLDLDVASDVEIEGGFEAKGWINVRSPLPFLVYLLLIIMELLRQGRSREVERILAELQEMEEIRVSRGYMYVPEGGSIGDVLTSKGGIRIGDRSVVPGVRAGDWIRIGESAEIFGSLEGKDVIVAENSVIHGDLVARGKVVLGPGVHVTGSIKGRSVKMARDSVVEGEIVAPGGIRFTVPPAEEIQEKIGKFDIGMENVEGMLQ